MINEYQPLPNQTGANNFRGLTRTEDTQNQFITRVDHVISQKQKIFGHYLYQGETIPPSQSTLRFRRRACSTTRAWRCSTSRRGVPPS